MAIVIAMLYIRIVLLFDLKKFSSSNSNAQILKASDNPVKKAIIIKKIAAI